MPDLTKFITISRIGTTKLLSIEYNYLSTPDVPSVFYEKTTLNTDHLTEWSLNEDHKYVEVMYITGKIYQFGAADTIPTNMEYAAPVSEIGGVHVTDNAHLFELFDALMTTINS
jgi:hypothetical protein